MVGLSIPWITDRKVYCSIAVVVVRLQSACQQTSATIPRKSILPLVTCETVRRFLPLQPCSSVRSFRRTWKMASPIPLGLDPLKMLETLSKLPPDEQEELVQRVTEDMNDLDVQSGRIHSKDVMVGRFRQMRAECVREGGYMADQTLPGIQMGFSVGADTKPSSTSTSLSSLKPMICDEQDVGTTHRGRYLCGWVAVDDAFFGIASSVLMLEDVTGNLVEIAVYDLVDSALSPRERQYRVAAQFPKRKPIVVMEPYYKMRMDGTIGVRVDDPNEILEWSDVPTTLATWKQLGNTFFQGVNAHNGGRGALGCYQRALASIQPEIHDIAVLLTNAATCRFKRSDYTTAVQLSGAAVHLDPTYFKGWLRLAAALSETGVERGSSVVSRVVSQARKVLPTLSRGQEDLLERLVSKANLISRSIARSRCRSGALTLERLDLCFPTETRSKMQKQKL